MTELNDQTIVLILGSEDGPNDQRLGQLEDELQTFLREEASIDPLGAGMVAVNVAHPVLPSDELSEVVTVATEVFANVEDYVVVAEDHIDDARELLNE